MGTPIRSPRIYANRMARLVGSNYLHRGQKWIMAIQITAVTVANARFVGVINYERSY